MNAESLFSLAGTLVLPGWLLLLFLPRWRRVTPLVTAITIPALLAILYVWLIVVHLPGAGGGFGSLGDVSELFRNEYLLLAGWIHYLAFDLFIGSWQVRDAERNGVPHLAVVPCLVLTFLLGPTGLLLYLLIRAGVTRRVLPTTG
jgi:hypothetical protein